MLEIYYDWNDNKKEMKKSSKKIAQKWYINRLQCSHMLDS